MTEQEYGKSFVAFALPQSLRHQRTLLDLPLADEVAARYARMAEESLAAQRATEAADTVPLEAYRHQYLVQDLLSGAHFHSTN